MDLTVCSQYGADWSGWSVSIDSAEMIGGHHFTLLHIFIIEHGIVK